MKRAIVAGCVVASLALAGPAGAATPTEKRLTKQVTALQKDVKALKTQVQQLTQVMNVVTAFAICSTALSADALQGTWVTLDQKPGGTAVGPQQAVNDAGACQDLGVARGASATNLTAFHSLLRLVSFSSFFGRTAP
jgi:hypothetical protein